MFLFGILLYHIKVRGITLDFFSQGPEETQYVIIFKVNLLFHEFKCPRPLNICFIKLLNNYKAITFTSYYMIQAFLKSVKHLTNRSYPVLLAHYMIRGSWNSELSFT